MVGLAIALMLGGALIPLVVPLFRPPLIALRSASGSASRLRALELRKEAIYGAIREAGFDLRTGKVEQVDYDQQIVVLKNEAVGVVAEIEELKVNPPRGSRTVEQAVAELREGDVPEPEAPQGGEFAPLFCTQCGQRSGKDDLFCPQCGTGLERNG